MSHPPPLGLYVHWPYCTRICPYCDFNVVRDRGRADEAAALAGAIVADISATAALIGPRRLVSIFFGGGTPSLMAPAQVAAIVETARRLWETGADLEITLEANPTDAEAARFAAFAAAGVNRLSLGVQSLDDAALCFLGRNHDSAAARRAVETAKAAFSRLSIDLIYALPDQSVAAWTAQLRQAVALGAEHLSPYQLTVAPGTAFHRAASRKAWRPPDGAGAADLFEATAQVLEDAGFDAYEISNHARGEAARARHNLIYWRGQDYVGVGPGAHGRLTFGGCRWASLAPNGIGPYIEAVNSCGIGSVHEQLSPRDIALERLLMGLRTREGVAIDELSPLHLADEMLRGLEADEMATLAGGRITVIGRGRLVLDRITAELAGSV
ncbi:MAG TPA: radical SAM family heme chaperone HemW [Caulobacteraceae bacterium]